MKALRKKANSPKPNQTEAAVEEDEEEDAEDFYGMWRKGEEPPEFVEEKTKKLYLPSFNEWKEKRKRGPVEQDDDEGAQGKNLLTLKIQRMQKPMTEFLEQKNVKLSGLGLPELFFKEFGSTEAQAQRYKQSKQESESKQNQHLRKELSRLNRLFKSEVFEV